VTPKSYPAKWIQPDWKKLTKFTTGVSFKAPDLAVPVKQLSGFGISAVSSVAFSGNIRADIFGEKLAIDMSGQMVTTNGNGTVGFSLVFSDGSASLKFNTSLASNGISAGMNYCLKAAYPSGYIPNGRFLKESLKLLKPRLTWMLNEKLSHLDTTYGGQNVARFERDYWPVDGGHHPYKNMSGDILYDATPVHASYKWNSSSAYNSYNSGEADLNFNNWVKASDISTDHCSGTWVDFEEATEATIPLLAYDTMMQHLQDAGLNDLTRVFPERALPLFSPRMADALAQLDEPPSGNSWAVVFVVCGLASVSMGAMFVLLRRRTSSQYEPLLEA